MSNENNPAIPTLYEWGGGMPAFEKLFDQFYDKVLADDILEPVFKHMSARHRRHVAHFVAEVLGGPKIYSESEGSHFEMIKKHLQKHLEELPTQDEKSRVVVAQMLSDEARHADMALSAGGYNFPAPVKGLMTLISKAMTETSYRI